ncbi:MAG: hypothetical protein IKI63_02485 [Clostridia bacterium]|nr:hypothetical protein [Clostridia bacterium]
MASISDSDETWRARVRDAAALAAKRGKPCFVGFLDEHQRAVTEPVVRACGEPYRYDGGYPDAQRTMLCICPSDFPMEACRFPFAALGFSYRSEAALSHRDFLGTLLSCGVGREAIGDILCGQGLSVAFVSEKLLPFLQQQITRVGGEGVTLFPHYDGPLPKAAQLVDMRGTVASSRLDCVVASLAGCSRSQAVERITAGFVSINHMPCTAISRDVREGDVLSLRGVGRFRVEELHTFTKKGRLVLLAKQYK